MNTEIPVFDKVPVEVTIVRIVHILKCSHFSEEELLNDVDWKGDLQEEGIRFLQFADHLGFLVM